MSKLSSDLSKDKGYRVSYDSFNISNHSESEIIFGHIMNKFHQRVGAISNAHAGAEFEEIAFSFFQKQGISLIRNFSVELGFSMKKKKHRFDFGTSDPKLIIECKSHRWTVGGKVPSAKMTVWNEAMLYFYLAPKDFKKIFFNKMGKFEYVRYSQNNLI
mgnify:CR=1 FL=1